MSNRRRLSFWLLALALLLAQMLGQMHRSLHGSVLLARATQAAGPQAADGAAARDGFSHLSDTDCRLYDQLLHADLLPGSIALPMPLALPTQVLRSLCGSALARWAAQYDARGPPQTT